MKGKREEAEVIIRIDQMDGCAYICVSAWPAMHRKMTKRYGPGLDSKGNSCRWKVPIRAISFRGPEKKAGNTTGMAFAGLKRQLGRGNRWIWASRRSYLQAAIQGRKRDND